MGFESLKIEFKNYIIAKYGLTLEEYELKYSDSNYLFGSEDFKTFFKDNHGADLSVLSEEEIEKIAELGIITDEIIEEIENENETIQEEVLSEETLSEEALIIEEEMELQEETTEEIPLENNQDEDLIVDSQIETEVPIEQEEEILSDESQDKINDSNIVGEEKVDENIQEATEINISDEENKEKLSTLKFSEKNKDEIVKMLNDLFEDDSFLEINDSNGNKTIEFEELERFYNTIKGYDGKEDEVSIAEIKLAMQKIEKGEFQLIEEDLLNDDESEEIVEEKDIEKEDKKEEIKKEEKDKDVAKNTNSSSSTGGSSGGSSSSYSSSSNNNNNNSTKKTEEQTSKFEGMSVSELESEEKAEQDTLNQAQNDYLSAQSGSHPDLVATKEGADNAQKSLTDAIESKEEGLGVELDRLYTESRETSEQKTTLEEEIKITQTNKAAQEQIITNCDARISELESLSASLQEQLSAADESESEAAAGIQAKIAEIASQIAAEKEKKTAAENEKAKLEEQEQKLNETLSETNEKIAKIEEDYAKVEEKLNTLLEDPQIKTLYESYENALLQHELKRNELVQTTKSTMDAAQANLSAIRKQMPIAQSKEDKAEFGGTFSMLDYNKEIGEGLAATAEKMWSGKSAQGLCLGGVSKSFGAYLKDENGESINVPFASAYMAYYAFTNDPEGYKERTGQEMNDRQKEVSQELSERFKQVEVSESELDTLPAGAVVIWDATNKKVHGHISISLGNGKEASDAVYSQSHSAAHDNAKYYVFIPVD